MSFYWQPFKMPTCVNMHAYAYQPAHKYIAWHTNHREQKLQSKWRTNQMRTKKLATQSVSKYLWIKTNSLLCDTQFAYRNHLVKNYSCLLFVFSRSIVFNLPHPDPLFCYFLIPLRFAELILIFLGFLTFWRLFEFAGFAGMQRRLWFTFQSFSLWWKQVMTM